MQFLDIDVQLDGIFLKALGFESTNNTAGSSTAVDQINANLIVSPDILNSEWAMSSYSIITEIVMQLFYIVLVTWCICYLVNHFGDGVDSYVSATVFLKRAIIAVIMIYCGPWILMELILINEEISYMFGFGSVDISELLIDCLTAGYGSLVTGIASAGTLYLALFYLIRLFLIALSLGLWVLAWLLWVAGSLGWGIAQRAENFATFLLTFIIINIFLGAGMCFVFWIGTLFISFANDSSYLVDWATDLTGLLVIIVSGCIPIVLFLWLIYNPTVIVTKVAKVLI